MKRCWLAYQKRRARSAVDPTFWCLQLRRIDLAHAIWPSLDRRRNIRMQVGPDPQMVVYFDSVRRGAVSACRDILRSARANYSKRTPALLIDTFNHTEEAFLQNYNGTHPHIAQQSRSDPSHSSSSSEVRHRPVKGCPRPLEVGGGATAAGHDASYLQKCQSAV